MEIRDAILKAADHIERNPGLFSFIASHIPSDCGTPGCAVGWINYFGGHARRAGGVINSSPLGVDETSFYHRMNRLGFGWMHAAASAAQGLRAYADKYHPAAKPPLDRAYAKFRAAFERQFA